MDFIALLGIAPDFDIDVKQLEAAYVKAQLAYHPDRMVGKNTDEKIKAATLSTQINEAFSTLKTPLKRAQYLLKRSGIDAMNETSGIKPAQEVLMYILNIREQVEDANSQQALEALDDQLKSTIQADISSLSVAFKENSLPNAAQLTIRLGYLQKCLEDIRIQKKNRFAKQA